jgi:hypothetical protein
LEERVRRIILPSAVFFATLIIIFYVIYIQRLSFPVGLPGLERLELSFLAYPLIALITFNYLSVVSEELLVGDMVAPLSMGLKRISYTSFLLFLSGWDLMPRWIIPVAYFLFYASILNTCHEILTQYVRQYNEIFEPVATMFYIIFLGLLGSQAWFSMYQYFEASMIQSGFIEYIGPYLDAGLAGAVNNVILASTGITAAVSLTKIFVGHPNRYLNVMGRLAGGRLEQIIFVNFIVVYYFLLLRGFLFKVSGVNPQYIVITEWALICIGFYLLYRKIRDYTNNSIVKDGPTGWWSRHQQKVQLKTDPQMDRLSAAVDRFIMDGDKNEFAVLLTLIMKNAGQAQSTITNVVSQVLKYEDLKPPIFGFIWQAELVERRNRSRRRKIIDLVLSSIQLKQDEISERNDPETRESAQDE